MLQDKERNKGTPYFSADQIVDDGNEARFFRGDNLIKICTMLVVIIIFGIVLEYLIRNGLKTEESTIASEENVVLESAPCEEVRVMTSDNEF